MSWLKLLNKSILAFSMKTFGLAPHIGHNCQDLVSVKMFKTFHLKTILNWNWFSIYNGADIWRQIFYL